MKKVFEVSDEGLNYFLGKRIFIVAQSYFYVGKLTGINETCVLLEDSKFVLESGSFEEKGLAIAEKIPGGKCYVMIRNIECFFESKE